MQAKSLFIQRISKPVVEGLLSLWHSVIWLGSLQGHLTFLYTPCLSSTTFTWSSSSTSKSVSCSELLNWYRLKFSVESFFLLCWKRERGRVGGRWGVISLLSQASLPFQIWKIIILLQGACKNGSEQNFKHTGTACSNQIISVCNPVTSGRLLSINHSCHGSVVREHRTK